MTNRDRHEGGVQQVTLGGGEVDVEPVACEKYQGDVCGPAEYAVDVLSYEVGHEITIKCCQSCRDEFAEWVDSDKIRELRRAERLEG